MLPGGPGSCCFGWKLYSRAVVAAAPGRLRAGSSPAPMQLEHARETLPCSARQGACLSSLAERRETPGILPSTGKLGSAGSQLSSAQPCVRGPEAGAEGVSDVLRRVGVPVAPRFALPLCLLMDHRSLYGCCCQAKSLLKDTQRPLPRNLTLSTSAVQGIPAQFPSWLLEPSPSLASGQLPALLSPSAPAGGGSAASGSGPLQSSAGVSGAGGYKVQGRAHQPHHRVQVAFGSSP